MNKLKYTLAATGLFAVLATLLSFVMLSMNKVAFYIIGHRGTRGFMPENTIHAMKMNIITNYPDFLPIY